MPLQDHTAAALPLQGMRILLVEDYPANQRVASAMLTVEGALVAVVENGAEAVEAVRDAEPPFDAVLMDINMPLMDGLTATREIRNTLGQRSLPIVALTTNNSASDHTDCLAAGMNDHIGKPFERADLVAVLLRVTGRAPVAASAPEPVAQSLPAPVAGVGSAATLAATPVIDLQAVLTRMSGMKPVLIQLAQELLLELDTTVAQYRHLLQSSELAEARRLMHNLKGISAMLDLPDLSAHAKRLEMLCKSADCDVALALAQADALALSVGAAQQALTTALAALESGADS